MSPTGYPDYPTSLTKRQSSPAFNPPTLQSNTKSTILQNMDGKSGYSITGFINQYLSHQYMRSSQIVPLLLCLVMLSASIAGCLGSDDGSDKAPSPIEMIVYYETTSGTIVEEIRGGVQFSEDGVELAFDFARTTSQNGQMKSFYVVPGDGASQIVANADETAEIRYTYMTHGLFTVYLGAIDDQGNDNNISITVRIEKQIIWSEDNADSPREMEIYSMPDCECAPEFIKIESTIINRDDFFGGNQDTITWHLNDPEEEEQGTHTEIIGEDQDASWNYNQYNVMEGIWTLSVTIDQGSDNIDINHDVTIKYLAEESEPNPFSVGEE